MGCKASQVVKNLPTKAGEARGIDRFDHYVRKISWRRAWQPTPVFFPGESQGQRSLAGSQSRTQLSTGEFSSVQLSSVQSLSRVRLFATPWTAVCQASLSITKSRSLLKLMSIESVMPSNHLILSPPSPPAFNFSQHQGLF